MNLEALIDHDKGVLEALRRFYNDPKFKDIRLAFTSHAAKSDVDGPLVAHGNNLGVRYVFNKIEELVILPPRKKPEPRQQSSAPDPDLAS